MFSTCSSLSNHILHTDSHIFHDSWECFLRDIANFPGECCPWVDPVSLVWDWNKFGLLGTPRKKSQVGLSPGACTTWKCRRKLRWIWGTHFVSCHHSMIFVLWFTVNLGIFYAWWWLPKQIVGLLEWEKVGQILLIFFKHCTITCKKWVHFFKHPILWRNTVFREWTTCLLSIWSK